MKVLAVTHGPDVGPELLGDVVREGGHELVEWDIASAGAPTVDADAVIVLGGHQNVGEELEHPWLYEEYDALRRWVAAGTPLLGVCLGAQTLAHAAGARVAPAARRYGGFYETELTDAGAGDPVLGALPRRFAALNANAYGFTVPPEGVPLARGAGLEQAFRVGERAWGVQFHPRCAAIRLSAGSARTAASTRRTRSSPRRSTAGSRAGTSSGARSARRSC